MDSYNEDGSLRDERQTALVALRAVAIAYLNGELSADDLRSCHVCVSYNSHKQELAFGKHPFFDLEIGLEFAFHEYFHERSDENGFRDEVRRLTGYVSVNITTGTMGSNLTVHQQ